MDWNNDGKKDLLLGDAYGNIRLYLNVGSAASPVFDTNSFIQVGGGTFCAGNYAKPCVVDWNNDGKKDILCGNYDGRVYLLLNTGTDGEPSFSQQVLIQDGGADLYAGNWSSPLVVDWDKDGKKDLVVGNADGVVRFYRNQGTDGSPVFNGFTNLTAGGALLDVGTYSHPALADWNNDGGKDLLVGSYDGFVTCFFAIPEEAMIAYESVALDDAAGNGDGLINPGERVKLRVTLQNVGLKGTTGVGATLSCTDSYVAVTANAAGYGEMPGMDAKKQGDVPYEIEVATNCPTPRQVELVLTATNAVGKTWTVPFTVMVYTSSQISGVVTLDEQAASGVTIEYTGPMSGTRLTDNQGKYLFGGINGTYTLVAKKAGWLDSASVQVTVPPNKSSVNFAFTTARVAGRVTDAKTGSALVGATVQYAGALSGSVSSGSDGRYEFARVYGRATTLTLVTKKAGYFDSAPKSVTVPPDATGVDFAMGYSDIDVTPTSFDITGVMGEVLTRTLSIGNLGTENLTWGLWNQIVSTNAASLVSGDVIRKFATPTEVGNPYGVTFDGSVVWVSNYSSSKLYKLDPVSGAVLGTLDVSAATKNPWGLDWDGVNLWVTDYSNRKIYAVNPATGQPVKTLDAPANTYPTGVALGEGYVWVMDYANKKVYKLDPATGSVVLSWTLPTAVTGYVYGLEYFNGAIWVAAYYGDGKVFKLNAQDGTVISSFQGPDNYILDLAESGTGPMWMISYSGRMAYLVDLGEVLWLKESPTSGTVSGGGTQAVQLTLDTVAAKVGAHEATIHIRSNDPDEAEVLVPVKFTVEHNPNNHPPVAASQSVTTDEDTAKAITLAATDADGHALTYAIVSQPANGTLSGTVPNVTYTPKAKWNGTDSFTFKASDYEYESNIATVTVKVNAVNDAPVARADNYRTDPDTALTVSAPGVLGNDSDVDGDSLRAVLVTNVSHGTLTLNSDGSFQYVPAGGYFGADTFTYKANDGAADSAPATVTIRVAGAEADIIITCDNGYDLYVNGVKLGSGSTWNAAQSYLAVALQAGKNVIAVKGTDAGGVAGLLADLVISGQRMGSSTNWKVSPTEATGWTDVGYDDSGWARASDWGAYGMSPWGTGVSGMPASTPGRWIWSSNNDADDLLCFRYSFTVSAGSLDTDGDGMPDAWETANGLDPNDAADANADSDGDGISNLKECLAGTDPRNASSRLEITGLRPAADGFTILWSSVAGKHYRIRSTTNLAAGAWEDLTNHLPCGSASSTCVIPADGGPQRFYRVLIEP